MYGSWTENVILWRNSENSNFKTLIDCSFLRNVFFKSVLKKLFNYDDEKYSKNSAVNKLVV